MNIFGLLGGIITLFNISFHLQGLRRSESKAGPFKHLQGSNFRQIHLLKSPRAARRKKTLVQHIEGCSTSTRVHQLARFFNRVRNPKYPKKQLGCRWSLSFPLVDLAVGQNPVLPVNIPIRTKMGSKMGGAPTVPPNGILLVLTHRHLSK